MTEEEFLDLVCAQNIGTIGFVDGSWFGLDRGVWTKGDAPAEAAVSRTLQTMREANEAINDRARMATLQRELSRENWELLNERAAFHRNFLSKSNPQKLLKALSARTEMRFPFRVFGQTQSFFEHAPQQGEG